MTDFSTLNATSMASLPTFISNGGNLFFLCLIVFGGLLLIYAISSLERYTKLWAALNLIFSTLTYTLYGIVLSGIGYGLYLICGVVASAAGTIDPVTVLVVIGGYIGVTVLGYVGVLVYRRLKQHHNMSHPERKGIEGTL